MTTYRISNRISGADLGIFEGATPLDAIKALSRDCGYRSLEDEADTLGATVEALIAEMRCDEVA